MRPPVRELPPASAPCASRAAPAARGAPAPPPPRRAAVAAPPPRRAAVAAPPRRPEAAALAAAAAAAAAAALAAPAARAAEAAAAAAAAAVPSTSASAASASAAAVAAALAAGTYAPSPAAPPSWEIWVGAVVGVIPFIFASVEFSKRVLIQRRCPECAGSGLVSLNSKGQALPGGQLRKCAACGGFLPWLGWRRFWLANLDVGNGGFLLQPRGQTGVLYKVPPPLDAAARARGAEEAARRAAAGAAAEEGVGGDAPD
jgi:hypothetical protein